MGFFMFDSVFNIMFILTFLLVFGVFIVVFVRMIGEWSKNNSAPRLTVPAVVVSKRVNYSRHRNHSTHHMHSSTFYYVTFQVESGDRMELSMSGQDYGMLVEGDRGMLSFQRNRYLGFERS